MWRSNKKGLVTWYILIALIVLILFYFPVGTAIAKALGIYTTTNTKRSYNDVVKSVKSFADNPKKAEESVTLKFDEDSAILGFTALAHKITIKKRNGDVEFEFPKPAECSGRDCICFCDAIEHDTVLGAGAYHCKTPDLKNPGETHMECTTNLGISLVDSIPGEHFSGQTGFLKGYDIEGGFVFGIFTWGYHLTYSTTFTMGESPQILIQKGSGEYVALCINNDNKCLDPEVDRLEMLSRQALELYNQGMAKFSENTPESLREAAEIFDKIIQSPEFREGLGYTERGSNNNERKPYLSEMSFDRALIEHRLGNDIKSAELLQQYLDAGYISDSSFVTNARAKISEYKCSGVPDSEKDCSCFTQSREACEGRDGCYFVGLDRRECNKCEGKITRCSSYIGVYGYSDVESPSNNMIDQAADLLSANERLEGYRKEICNRNPCKETLNAECEWGIGPYIDKPVYTCLVKQS